MTDSPVLGQSAESFGQVIISSNDNSHGILELSPITASVQEFTGLTTVNVTRIGGAFGEVRFKTC